MKKLISYFLILSILLSCVACGNQTSQIQGGGTSTVDLEQKEDAKQESDYVPSVTEESMKTSTLYNEAFELMNNGEYAKAKNIFNTINMNGGFDKSKEYSVIAENLDSLGPDFAGTLSKDFTKIYLPEYVCDGIKYSDFSRAYGCENVCYIVNPKTTEDYENNFLYSVLTGNYQIVSENNIVCYNWRCLNSGSLTYAYDALLDVFINVGVDFYCVKGQYIITLDGGSVVYSSEQISENLVKSYNKALELRNELYSRGTINDTSSELEKVEAYHDFLNEKLPMKPVPDGLKQYEIAWNDFDPKIRTNCMYFNGVESVFFGQFGACAPHAAVFNLFMNIEGIKNCDVHCAPFNAPPGQGHDVTYIYIDNEEYIVDWFNKKGVKTFEDSAKYDWNFEKETLNNARVLCGAKEGSLSYRVFSEGIE